jgi:hypothetical protein
VVPLEVRNYRASPVITRSLVEPRTEWQRRIHAVLYHDDVPHSRKLPNLRNRERIAALELPAVAPEHLTVALELIGSIDIQIGPTDPALRD